MPLKELKPEDWIRHLQTTITQMKGQLDIIKRVAEGETDDFLSVDYGGLGWEKHPAVQAVYKLREKALEDRRAFVEDIITVLQAAPEGRRLDHNEIQMLIKRFRMLAEGDKGG